MTGASSSGPLRPAPDSLASIPTFVSVDTQRRHENFPVASFLLPRATRRHLVAIYGFARLADDIGDRVRGDRLHLLDWLEAELDRAYAGAPEHPVMRRLAHTLRELDLPRRPFLQLIEANRQDQWVTRYDTYEQLLAYCELSANPVGHLVLAVLDAQTPERIRYSDAICTGLQLVEHWQDVGEDFRRGRIYLPLEDLERFGTDERDLTAPVPSPALRRLLAFEVERARHLLDVGAALVATFHGRVRVAVAGFVAGGRAAADAIERSGYDVLRSAPRATRTMVLRHIMGLVRGGR
jgi:squalene synthase HpnC